MKINEIEIYVTIPELHEILVNKGLEGVYRACDFASCEGSKSKILEKASKMIKFLREMGFDFVEAFGLNNNFYLNHHTDNTCSEFISFTFNAQASKEQIGLNELTRRQEEQEG